MFVFVCMSACLCMWEDRTQIFSDILLLWFCIVTQVLLQREAKAI